MQCQGRNAIRLEGVGKRERADRRLGLRKRGSTPPISNAALGEREEGGGGGTDLTPVPTQCRPEQEQCVLETTRRCAIGVNVHMGHADIEADAMA